MSPALCSSSVQPRLFLVGYPGEVGGANTEAWHTLKLWRRFGAEVLVLPTSPPSEAWRARVATIGCRTIDATPDQWPRVPGLPGALVISFCNREFLREAGRFRDLGCRIVWVGCMNWLFAAEREHYLRHGPFDAYVFQSEFQRSELAGQLEKFGVKPSQCHRIPGAFAWEDFPLRPLAHPRSAPLVVGRLSRAAPDKFSANTWPIYRRIPHPIRARVMAWDPKIARKLGPPPPWAQCLPANAEPAVPFLGSLHCMLQVNGGAKENWPRSGLEAMACGVAIVAENRWGWREMIRHGQTGYLADSEDELAYYAARLAYDEDHRLELIRSARRALEEELAPPERIWEGWSRLFSQVLG
jgi:hypothetical protein